MSGNFLDEWIAAAPGAAAPAGGGALLWRTHDGRASGLIDARELPIFERLLRAAPRAEHVQALVQAGVAADQAARVLAALEQRGMVRSLRALVPSGGPFHEPAPAPVAVIRTHQRPDAFARLLRSIVATTPAPAPARWFVVDDSNDQTVCASNLDAAKAFARETAVPVHYLGPQEQAREIERWQTSMGAATDALTGLVSRRPLQIGGGRAWNWGVLAAAGSALAMIDDDELFPLRLPPEHGGALELGDRIVSHTRYFDAHESPEAELPPLGEECWAYLRRYVGRGVGELVASEGLDPALLRNTSPEQWRALRASQRVTAAFTGVWGGLAFDSAAYLNVGAPSAMESLWRAPYRHARLEADRVFHGVRRPRLLPFAVYTPLLVDARGLLPFALTRARADDTSFHALLGAIEPEAAFIYVPAAVGHAPEQARGRLAASEQPLLSYAGAFVSHCVGELADLLGSDVREARLAAIGRALGTLANAPADELRERVLRHRHVQLADFCDRLARRIAEAPGAPAEWRAYAERVLAVNRRAMVEERVDDARLAQERAALAEASDAAAAWPALYDAMTQSPLATRIGPL